MRSLTVLDGIDVFVEVVGAQSFSRAARRLGMPTSTVSAKIARLEDRLGTTLIRRTTRQLSVTDAGQRYYEHCLRALAEIEQAEHALADTADEPAGALRISAAADIAQYLLVPLIEQFLRLHPKTSVDLVVTNRQVDLVSEGIDLAVRSAIMKDSSLVATRYLEGRVGLWATEAYLAEHGTPKATKDLAQHRIVSLSRAKDLMALLDRSGQLVEVNSKSRLACDDLVTCRAFVETDAGIGLLPDFIAAHPKSPLVRVLPRLATDKIAVQLVYPAQRFLPQTVRAFIDLAKAQAAARAG